MKETLESKLLLQYGDTSETIMNYINNRPSLGIDKIEKIDTTPDGRIVMSYKRKIGDSDAEIFIIVRNGEKDEIIIEKNLKALHEDSLIVEYETTILNKKGIVKEESSYHDSLKVAQNTVLNDINMNEYNPHPNENRIYNCNPRVYNTPTYTEITRHDDNPTVATLHITELNDKEKKKASAIVSCWDDRDPLGMHINKGGRYYVYFLFDLEKGGYIVPRDIGKTEKEVKEEMEREKELFFDDIKNDHPELIDAFIIQNNSIEK